MNTKDRIAELERQVAYLKKDNEDLHDMIARLESRLLKMTYEKLGGSNSIPIYSERHTWDPIPSPFGRVWC